jgi:hypothetical protein
VIDLRVRILPVLKDRHQISTVYCGLHLFDDTQRPFDSGGPCHLDSAQASEPSQLFLGKDNDLAAAAGAACRTIAPLVVGLLYGGGADIGFTGLAWWVAGAVAAIGTAQLWFIQRKKNVSTTIRTATYLAAVQTACTEESLRFCGCKLWNEV